MRAALVLLPLLLAITACAPSRSDVVRATPAQTPRESCTAACNRDYSICTDEPSTSRETLPGTGRISGGNQRLCDGALSSCLLRCKGAGIN